MKKNGTLLVQEAGLEYQFYEIDHTDNDRRSYLGKIYPIYQKGSFSYAIIFDNLYDRYIRMKFRQPGLISRPVLLATGSYKENEKNRASLKKIVENSVRQHAGDLAKQKGLELRLELSQPKCTFRSIPFDLSGVPNRGDLLMIKN